MRRREAEPRFRIVAMALDDCAETVLREPEIAIAVRGLGPRKSIGRRGRNLFTRTDGPEPQFAIRRASAQRKAEDGIGGADEKTCHGPLRGVKRRPAAH